MVRRAEALLPGDRLLARVHGIQEGRAFPQQVSPQVAIATVLDDDVQQSCGAKELSLIDIDSPDPSNLRTSVANMKSRF